MNINANALSILSVVLSGVAIYVAFTRQQKTLKTTAADRALQRFNRINEILLNKPHLNKIFAERYENLKTDPEAKTFIWYIFNQLEGTFLDSKFRVLKKEYFKSYDKWLTDVLSKENALRDFVEKGKRSPKIKDSFSDSYWKYLQRKV